MRTRGIVATLILMLIGVSAGGCQIIAGLTVLEITSGSGGQGGGSCSPCANGEACHDNSDCQSKLCAKSGGGTGGDPALGICKAAKLPGVACTAGEECGTGFCTDGVCCDVADCAGECSSCAASGTGTCKSTPGATCGASCGDGVVMAGKCDGAGQCSPPTPTMCPSEFGCNPDTLTCNTSCKSSSDCASSGFCALGITQCATCGVSPPQPGQCKVGQNGCDDCDPSSKNACIMSCAAGKCGAGPQLTLMTTSGPARLVCNGQCNGLTVLCQGPYACDVVCDSGGCDGLVLLCGPDGPCNLICKGTGCAGAGATMKCGDNACTATCEAGGPAKVSRNCGGSCSCPPNTCL